MTDFYPLVLNAISKLDRNTEEERQALYQRARTTLAARLRDIDPPLSQQRMMEERLAFEEAVRRAEADAARSLVERELLSKLADTIEHDTAVGEGTADPRDAWTQLAGRLPQSRSGAVFEYTQDTFAFGPRGTPADRAAAADPLVQSIRSELEHKARELAGHLSRISDPARLRGLLDAVRGFAQRVGGSEMEVAGDIGTLWVLGVALKAYVDSEKTDLSEQTFVPLEADLLRALRDLVGASGPWIRMFPTGCAFDDQTRSSGPPAPEIVDAAVAFLRSAERAALLDPETARILRAVPDAGGSPSFAGTAGHWTVRTASNLAVAMLLVLASTVRGYGKAAEAAVSSDIARRVERVVLQHEPGLLQVFSHLPDDTRDVLRLVIDGLRASAEDDV